MARRPLTFAFGLTLFVAIGLATGHTGPRKAPGGFTGLSSPCEPAPPAFKTAPASKVVSTIDSTFAAEAAGARPAIVHDSRADAALWPIPPQSPRLYAPLLHRPPPANS